MNDICSEKILDGNGIATDFLLVSLVLNYA